MKNPNAIRVIAAIVFSLIAIVGSITLKTTGVVGEPTLVTFVTLSLLVGLIIVFGDRIQSINLREFELKLKEVKDTEASVKEVARAILEVIESQSHGVMLESYDDKKANEAITKLKTLIA